MTTTARPARRRTRAATRRRARCPRLVRRRCAHALDRPLTSYYLLLGASALLLTIGLIMVLSASSVYSYRVNDGDSYAVVQRQLVWVLIGLPVRVRRHPAAAPRAPPLRLARRCSSRWCCSR